jgi:LPS-assembly lipoprotein
MNNARRILLLLLVTLLLGGCGFHLRGLGAPAHFSFSSLYLEGHPNEVFEGELRRELERVQGLTLKTSPSEAEVTIHFGPLINERTILSLSSTGLVSQYNLSMHMEFRAEDAQGNELLEPTTINITHVFNYNANEPLAKAQEETQLFEGMRLEVVQTVMRRLAALQLLKKPTK